MHRTMPSNSNHRVVSLSRLLSHFEFLEVYLQALNVCLELLFVECQIFDADMICMHTRDFLTGIAIQVM